MKYATRACKIGATACRDDYLIHEELKIDFKFRPEVERIFPRRCE